MKINLNRLILFIVGTLVLAGLVACGGTAIEQEPAAEESVETPEPALEPVTEEESVEQPENEGSDDGNVESAEPVEVDLGEITPDSSDENAEPQEMPAPGRPGPNQELMEAIMNDLADRQGVSRADLAVEIESIEGREWRDSSLGCPAEGMMYMQVITPGYLVQLSSDGEQYEYHTDRSENFVLCVDGKPVG